MPLAGRSHLRAEGIPECAQGGFSVHEAPHSLSRVRPAERKPDCYGWTDSGSPA